MGTTLSVSKTYKKWINASVAIAAIFLGYTVYRFLNFINGQFELEASVGQIEPMIQGFSALIGIGSFFYVIKNSKTAKYLTEAFSELEKVVFPDKNETVALTIRVIILVTIVGIFLGIIDVLATLLLDQFLN